MKIHWLLLLTVSCFGSLSLSQLSHAQEALETEPLELAATTSDPIASDPIVQKDSTISLQGVLDPIETLRLAIRDPGIVSKVLVSEGSIVKSGDPIAILDTEMFAAEVSVAANELEIAKQETKNDVDLQYARISSEVNQQVLSRSQKAAARFPKSVSATELERLRLEYERSRLSGLQAERQQDIHRLTEALKQDRLSIAQLKLKNRTVESSIDGTVVQVFHTPGEFVDGGEPIARILNLSRLRVICAGDANVIDPNDLTDEAVFHVKIGNQGKTVSYPAKLTFISPEIDPVRQTFPIWAEIQNKGNQLKSGNLGRLEIKRKKK